jgi:hypothetical protein
MKPLFKKVSNFEISPKLENMISINTCTPNEFFFEGEKELDLFSLLEDSRTNLDYFL